MSSRLLYLLNEGYSLSAHVENRQPYGAPFVKAIFDFPAVKGDCPSGVNGRDLASVLNKWSKCAEPSKIRANLV
jgi:hypothetical protein